MKQCPKCGQTYNDGSLNFCLMDGAALIQTGSVPTVVSAKSPSSVPTVRAGSPTAETQTAHRPRRRSSIGFWIVLLVLVILLGGAGFAGLLFYLSRNIDQAASNRAINANPALSPKRSETPRPSISQPSTSAPTPQQVAPKSMDDDNGSNGSDEVTPISWTTAASGFKNDVGQTYKFECPPEGTSAVIWGSDIYTADSSICTAAVHAGIISLKSGGVVTIEYRPGRQIYGSTARNGITSNTFGEYPKSFVFKQ